MELQRENVISSEAIVDDVDTSDLTDRPNDYDTHKTEYAAVAALVMLPSITA
jgi:hypothetical protein